MARAVILLSGGLDSTVTLAKALSEGWEAHALTISYGQRHAVELEAARRVGRAAAGHQIMEIPLDRFGGSALTDSIDVPLDRPEAEMAEGIPVTYVPARNTVFLSLALAYAETLGATDIFIGVNAIDYSGYPDCRPEFVAAFENLANLATKAGVEGARYRIHAPLLRLSKPEIVRLGIDLGVDFGQTHSCYAPDAEGRACGRCDSCRIRAAAFEALGLADPALRRQDLR